MTVEIAVDGAVITIEPDHGARLASLVVDGHELLVTDAEETTGWGCYPMVPWAGRVREGRFHWGGRDVELPIDAPPHAIHGTVLATAWRQTGPASFASPLGPHWPWPGTVESVFELVPGALRWTLTVHAEEAMPVVLGWHPWFRRRSDGLGEASFVVDAPMMYQRDATGLPTGTLVTSPPGPWDDCFTGLRRPPQIKWSGGLALELSSSCDHWVVYDERSYGFCIEPQSGPPDAFNLGPTQIAAPGASVSHHLSLRWSRGASPSVDSQ